MTFLNWVFVSWAVITAALVLVLIYRSTISMKSDDQLFLDPAERQLEEHQQEIVRSLMKLKPTIAALAAGSGGLALLMLGMAAVQMWKGF